MKLHFLGTGAADWDISKPNDSIDFRRFSSLLIDDKLLIDPGPCIYEFAETFSYNDLFGRVEAVINTHSHKDHFSLSTLEKLNVPLTRFEFWETKEVSGYIITALQANHGTCSDAKHFIIESLSDGKRIFYGCDGAWLLYPAYREIIKNSFDMMIFDCTIGEVEGDYRIFEHNNLRMVEEMKLTLAKHSKRFMVSHMARTLHTDHNALVERCRKSGIEVARDNMTVIV